jgi:hypothetical protein
MFFSYDRDVSNIYYRAIIKLETVSKMDILDFFESLTYPKHWERYSEYTKDSILLSVFRKLVENKIVTLSKRNNKVYLCSLIHDENVYVRELKK